MPRARFAGVLAALSIGCGGSAGSDGSELLLPYDNLRGGIVFATRAIPGSGGYDLYWIPIPDVRAQLTVGFARLTDSQANETQPFVSRNGLAIAFASDDGIHLAAAPEGRIKRISDTRGTAFVDSLPTVSPNGDRVAWVRSDTSRPIGETGLFETFIVMANADATEERVVSAKPGVIQDSPAFDPSPDPTRTRIAWSEFAAASIAPGAGPTEYGVYVHDFATNTGTFACRSQGGVTPGTELLPARGRPFRCFGQHLVWPIEQVVVLGQDLLEVSLTGSGLTTIWGEVVTSFQAQQIGIPNIGDRTDGFFPAFPISASYDPAVSKVVFDGVIESLQGDQPSLGILLAEIDGSGTFRIQIDGYSGDLDTVATNGYLFSVATPRFIIF